MIKENMDAALKVCKEIICKATNISDPYEIKIFPLHAKGHSNLLDIATYLSPLASKFAIIADDNVASLYARDFTLQLCNLGLDAHLFTFPNGEIYKTRETKEILENKLFENAFGKDSCVIGFGGGVVLDISGYLAATYCRGVPLVMIPTSLLAMVDASIGGKNGLNVSFGKNMIGTIYPPKKVLIDPVFLHTLPKKELNNGVVEIIKHGLIADVKLFEYMEENVEKILALDTPSIEKIIFESCLIKKEIVEEDVKESGKRRLLNFGHTVGHAIEKVMDYSLSHGACVALGILAESYLSMHIKTLSQKSFDRIESTLIKYEAFQLPLDKKSIIQEIYDAMALDKKSLMNRPRFVMLDEIGSASNFDSDYCTFVSESLVKESIEQVLRDR